MSRAERHDNKSSALVQKILLQRIRDFQKSQTENKNCIVCGDVGVSYICTTFGTFVCTSCAGIHREFPLKVKGINVSLWSPEEVKFIENNGNRHAHKYLLKHMKGPHPASTDFVALRKFVNSAFVERRWRADAAPASKEERLGASSKQHRSTAATGTNTKRRSRNRVTSGRSSGQSSDVSDDHQKRPRRRHRNSRSSSESQSPHTASRPQLDATNEHITGDRIYSSKHASPSPKKRSPRKHRSKKSSLMQNTDDIPSNAKNNMLDLFDDSASPSSDAFTGRKLLSESPPVSNKMPFDFTIQPLSHSSAPSVSIIAQGEDFFANIAPPTTQAVPSTDFFNTTASSQFTTGSTAAGTIPNNVFAQFPNTNAIFEQQASSIPQHQQHPYKSVASDPFGQFAAAPTFRNTQSVTAAAIRQPQLDNYLRGIDSLDTPSLPATASSHASSLFPLPATSSANMPHHEYVSASSAQVTHASMSSWNTPYSGYPFAPCNEPDKDRRASPRMNPSTDPQVDEGLLSLASGANISNNDQYGTITGADTTNVVGVSAVAIMPSHVFKGDQYSAAADGIGSTATYAGPRVELSQLTGAERQQYLTLRNQQQFLTMQLLSLEKALQAAADSRRNVPNHKQTVTNSSGVPELPLTGSTFEQGHSVDHEPIGSSVLPPRPINCTSAGLSLGGAGVADGIGAVNNYVVQEDQHATKATRSSSNGIINLEQQEYSSTCSPLAAAAAGASLHSAAPHYEQKAQLQNDTAFVPPGQSGESAVQVHSSILEESVSFKLPVEGGNTGMTKSNVQQQPVAACGTDSWQAFASPAVNAWPVELEDTKRLELNDSTFEVGGVHYHVGNRQQDMSNFASSIDPWSVQTLDDVLF
eukprot:Lankesteria_metandrocarpae@DN4672_c0_g1_i1.p1